MVDSQSESVSSDYSSDEESGLKATVIKDTVMRVFQSDMVDVEDGQVSLFSISLLTG